MNSSPTISVVIPCFNDGYFLSESLESVLAQTLKPTETLIINDGSTDPKTIEFLHKIDTNGVRVINQENRGLPGARNAGIHNATSKYVYFLDADDILYPECLARLVGLMEENDEAVAATSKIQVAGGPMDGTVWCEPCNPYLILVNNQLCAGIMLRSEAVHRYDLWYDESMRHGYEDWELNIRLARIGKPVLFCPDPLYRYRIRGGSLLSTARKRHVEILSYIRRKHRDLYEPERLLSLKRSHAPAVLIRCSQQHLSALREWLFHQTLQDCIAGDFTTSAAEDAPYTLYFSDTDSLKRLPFEALESALMALETNPLAKHCVLGIKENSISWFANGGDVGSSQLRAQPVAVITRRSHAESSIQEILTDCELLIEFHDQRPGTAAEWNRSQLRFSNTTVLCQRDPAVVRKRLSLLGRNLLGSRFQQKSISLYDAIYGILVSNGSLEIRRKLQEYLGVGAERTLSKAFYGLFLMTPPTDQDNFQWKHLRSPRKDATALFFTPPQPAKINILIATAWLNEGGVEQEILDLCRYLDQSRFRIIVATTRPSSHPWDHLARDAGASVYHLADFLRPPAIPNGLLHLVVNHHIDCLHIVHSRAAYESLNMLKRAAPWLQVTDRNVILDPGGGFPFVSAKLGKNLVDIRTVGHGRLADGMCKEYKLPRESLRVIYAGTDAGRIKRYSSQKRGLLREMCHVNADTPVVIFVGRFAVQKRPEVFLRSATKVFELRPECKAHFALVGDGDSKGSVEKLISRYNLEERVHLLGAHANAIELIADATLLMMPSAYEGLALVSFEAMALGVPQIFANVNGQSELITPETGILVNNGPGEEIRYAKACLELLSDPERRARMAAAGKERIRSQFTAENAVEQYAEIFEAMAEISRKRAAEIPHLRPPHINPLRELA